MQYVFVVLNAFFQSRVVANDFLVHKTAMHCTRAKNKVSARNIVLTLYNERSPVVRVLKRRTAVMNDAHIRATCRQIQCKTSLLRLEDGSKLSAMKSTTDRPTASKPSDTTKLIRSCASEQGPTASRASFMNISAYSWETERSNGPCMLETDADTRGNLLFTTSAAKGRKIMAMIADVWNCKHIRIRK